MVCGKTFAYEVKKYFAYIGFYFFVVRKIKTKLRSRILTYTFVFLFIALRFVRGYFVVFHVDCVSILL